MIFTRKSITKILYLLLSFINGISTNKQEKKEKFESLDKLEFQAKKEQFNVQKEISRLKDFKYETQQQLREIKSANIFLTNRVDNQEERIHILESILQQFKGIGPNGATPAFYAYMTKDENNPGVGHTLIYDNVIVNFGNSYNHSSGRFTAPTPGVYIFSYSTIPSSNSDIPTEIVKNQEVIGATYSNNRYHYTSTSSSTVVVSMTAGDVCFVRTSKFNTPSGSVYSRNDGRTSFSGWLQFYVE
ncbi:C1QL [Mytilus edulis]|uniref:C1QL n=1 Tax=Mytilus edulis TaxID=6550 RepID=A0A8S3UWW8_MYTED|nr:C1QL [Mytilus edulis]